MNAGATSPSIDGQDTSSMTTPSSSRLLCTVGLTSGGSAGILSRSAKSRIGTANLLFPVSAAYNSVEDAKSTKIAIQWLRRMCSIETQEPTKKDEYFSETIPLT